jgi:DNA polymerase III gamma/tau subunit
MRESLQIHYRPKTFEEFLGSEKTVKGILNKFDSPNGFLRSVLLYGPFGSGKTTLARLIAGKLGCKPSMFIEVDTAKMRGIDTSREIIDIAENGILLPPCKVIFIDEAHEMTSIAQDALLKTLEKPPDNVYFILATTRPGKLLDTVRSRVTSYKVEPLSDDLMIKLLDWVLEKEEKSIMEEMKDLIVIMAKQCPREALKILDQVFDMEYEEQKEFILAYIQDDANTKDLCRVLITDQKPEDKWAELKKLLGIILLENPDDRVKVFKTVEIEKFRRGVLSYIAKVLLNSRGAQAKRCEEIITIFSNDFFNSDIPGFIAGIYKASLK